MAANAELKRAAEKIMANIEAALGEKMVTASPLEKLKEQITVGDVVIKSTGKTS